VIDSHTGGEPTRVVVDGGPDLGPGPILDRLGRLRHGHDWLRTSLVNEPRGSQAMVGALIQPSVDRECTAAVIFFNNVGYLGMCGHGTIGVVTTLAYLGRIQPGRHTLETPIGNIAATLHGDGRVSFENVPSYRYRDRVPLPLPRVGTVVGDVAWGGNWFFLVTEHGQTLDLTRTDALTDFAWKIRIALRQHGITGKGGAEVDHVELLGPPKDPAVADSRNFVLCPGKAYDRSPCGTGTSANLACLAAEGKLPPGQTWRQQSIVGSVFEGCYRRDGNWIIPTITGQAHINAEVTLVIDPGDPLKHGIRR
jgi:4-hydroxyproline epimerase